MRIRRIRVLLLLFGLVAGCAGQRGVMPVEALDERTGVTVTSLKESVELLPSSQPGTSAANRGASFAYLGPVEWNRSGEFSYGLWVHVAPGNGAQPGDIHGPNALTLILDDGAVALTLMESPKTGREPYKQVAPWGQTAYFDLTVEILRRMAASRRLALELRASDGSVAGFAAARDMRAALTEYVRSRGLTGD